MAKKSVATPTKTVARHDDQPLHRWPRGDLVRQPVSSTSIWSDPVWRMDLGSGIGESSRKIRWDFELPDGSRLLDPEHEDMLDWLRRFTWSLIVAPANGLSKLRSLPSMRRGIEHLISWLVENRVARPSELTPSVVDSYLEDFIDDFAGSDDELHLTAGSMKCYLQFLPWLWEQRYELEYSGIEPMPAHPFGGRSATDMAEELALKPPGWWKPLPDEVAIPLINSATSFLNEPASDIVRLVEKIVAISEHHRGRGVTTTDAIKYHIRRQLYQFEFSKRPGEDAPWHPNLYAVEGRSRQIGSGRALSLMLDLSAACSIVLLTTTGMRVSELAMLQAGVDSQTGLPSCIEVRLSPTGLNEIFLLRSSVSKTEDVPREELWVVAMRPAGSVEIPLPVRALQILEALYRPIRVLSGSSRLFVPNLNGKAGFVSDLEEGPAQESDLNKGLLRSRIHQFVERWVDLSGLPDESRFKIADNDLVKFKETRGRCIHPHAMRKAYANFALAVDPRLLPAVQMQFKHVSMAMTESSYWGVHREQIEPLNSMQQQQTSLALYEAATGKVLMAGRMGERIVSDPELKHLVSGLGTSEAWKNVTRFAEERDLRIWFSPHGKCLPLVQHEMKCHKLANTKPNRALEPNYEWREPAVCAGCANFVLDRRHIQFWLNRYRENAAALVGAEGTAFERSLRVIAERAAQARILLRRMGVSEEEIEACKGEPARVDAEARLPARGCEV